MVRDYRRREFSKWDSIVEMDGLKLAVVDLPYYARRAKIRMPKAELTIVDSPRAFMTAPESTFDAMLYSAEAGSAWTLLHPEFSVVIPSPGVASVPVVFGLPAGEAELTRYVDAWINLNKDSGIIDRLYDYWILGQGAKKGKKRWSVVHNVLGWGNDDTPAEEYTPESE